MVCVCVRAKLLSVAEVINNNTAKFSRLRHRDKLTTVDQARLVGSKLPTPGCRNGLIMEGF